MGGNVRRNEEQPHILELDQLRGKNLNYNGYRGDPGRMLGGLLSVLSGAAQFQEGKFRSILKKASEKLKTNILGTWFILEYRP